MKWQMSNIFHSYVHGTGSNQPSIDSGTHPVDWPIYFEARRHSQTYQTPWNYVKWYWWWPRCQGCQMHLKVSRAQAWCPLGGDAVDFRRAWPPAKDLIQHNAYQDNVILELQPYSSWKCEKVVVVAVAVSSIWLLFLFSLLNFLSEGTYNIEGKGRLS